MKEQTFLKCFNDNFLFKIKYNLISKDRFLL